MRVSVDQATIDVDVSGNGDAIVLLHGFPLTREIWDSPTDQLSRSKLVIRPDLRGMGRSDVTDGPYLMESLAGDVAAVLDALGVERAAIAGHSLGGYVAMAFCRMYGERVTKLALVCSRLAADTPETAKNRHNLADLLDREHSIDPLVDAYLPKLLAAATLENRAHVVDRAREIARRNDPRGAAAMLRGMAMRDDSYDIAQELEMPVLILAGEADEVVGLPEAEEMRRAFPNAALKVVGRSGHVPMLEEPEALAELLNEFFT